MKKLNSSITVILITLISSVWISCDPNAGNPPIAPGAFKLSYGDSIIYLKPQTNNYIVYPLETRPGTYTAFPEGIQIDQATGAIHVNESETGLRYRITHTATDGTQTHTMVVLSGINFTDKFYRLSQHDSIASPVYNADASKALPLAGSIFDDGGTANSSGCDVKTNNGQINLAQTIRNGWLGVTPSNDARRDVDIIYRLNDPSGKAKNRLKVRLYFYTSMATIAPDLLETLNDRQQLGVFLQSVPSFITSSARVQREAKPRPPCVVIVAQ